MFHFEINQSNSIDQKKKKSIADEEGGGWGGGRAAIRTSGSSGRFSNSSIYAKRGDGGEVEKDGRSSQHTQTCCSHNLKKDMNERQENQQCLEK